MEAFVVDGLTFSEASDEEMACVRSADLGDGDPHDTLTSWHLISVRQGNRFQVFAVGKSSEGLWVATAPVVGLERLVRVRTVGDALIILGVRSLTDSRDMRGIVRTVIRNTGFLF